MNLKYNKYMSRSKHLHCLSVKDSEVFIFLYNLLQFCQKSVSTPSDTKTKFGSVNSVT